MRHVVYILGCSMSMRIPESEPTASDEERRLLLEVCTYLQLEEEDRKDFLRLYPLQKANLTRLGKNSGFWDTLLQVFYFKTVQQYPDKMTYTHRFEPIVFEPSMRFPDEYALSDFITVNPRMPVGKRFIVEDYD